MTRVKSSEPAPKTRSKSQPTSRSSSRTKPRPTRKKKAPPQRTTSKSPPKSPGRAAAKSRSKAKRWSTFAGDDKKKKLPPAPTTNFSQRVRKNFNAWDKNHNGYLTPAEIDRSMGQRRYTGDDAAALATLKSKVEDLQKLHNDEWGGENGGMTLNDLSAYERKAKAGGDGTSQSVDAHYSAKRAKLNGASGELFANGTPDPNAIKQGSIGDCYFIAAVAAKAQQDPEGLKKMIEQNDNGTYTVSFPGKKPVTVQAPTDAELSYYASSGKNGQWMTVLEKAYGKHLNNKAWLSTTTSPQDAADGGGFLSHGINALSNRGTNTDTLAVTSYEQTRTRLQEAMDDDRMVTALIRKNLPWENERWNNLPTGHVYSVMAYDAKTDMMTLRNPWGRTEPVNNKGQARDGRNDGSFQMSVKDFYKYFSQIAYEN